MPGREDGAVMTSEDKELILRYLDEGQTIVRYQARTKGPTDTDWQHRNVLTREDIASVNGQTFNYGVVTGERSNGLYDVDLDVQEAVTLAPLLLPKTERIHGRESNPDSHYWYRITDLPGVPSCSWEYKGKTLVELRGGCEGHTSQTTVPPSLHAEGGEQVIWHTNGPPSEHVYADLKADCATLASAVLLARHWPGTGTRDKTMMALAGALVRGTDWDDVQIDGFIQAVARVGGDEEWQKRKNAAAAREKLGAGGKITGAPRLSDLLIDGEDVVAQMREWLGLRKAAEGEDPREIRERQVAQDGYEKSDLGNARRLTDRFGNSVAWVEDWQDFLLFDGTCWREHQDLAVRKLVQQIHHDLWLDVHESVDMPRKILSDKARWALECGQSGRISGALREAKPLLRRDASVFNRQRLLIPGANGLTYDLGDGGKLRESRRDDYLTRTLAVTFAPDPGHPEKTFAFLRLLMSGDQQMVDYLVDRVIAPLLTGIVEAQEFFFFFGSQNAGKSTLLKYLARLLGRDFAYKIPLRGILRRRDPGYIRHDLAGLRGMRLAYSEEFRPGDTLDAGVLKDITGGGDITADLKGRNNITFESTAKLVIATNLMPELEDVDGAMRKRLRVVPFLINLPKYCEEHFIPLRDQEEVITELLAEAPAFVHYCVRRLVAHVPSLSMEMPDPVRRFTEGYLVEQDQVATWMEQCCEAGGETEERPFLDWHISFLVQSGFDGKKQGSENWFGRQLKSHGFSKHHTARGPVYTGSKLTALAHQQLTREMERRVEEGIERRRRQFGMVME